MAGIRTIVLSIGIGLAPSFYVMVVEHILLPRFEADFGFRGGRVSVDHPEAPYPRYAIIGVTPGGRLEQAGVRSGDVPVDYHQGLVVFYVALRDVSEGKSGEFMVVSKDEPPWDKRRTIKLSP